MTEFSDPELNASLKCGVIVLDKPQGPSSHQAAAWAADILGVKTGQGGTLDPLVSGVLVLMLGRAVRLAPVLLNHRKEYIALLRLHKDVPEEEIRNVAEEFKGRQYQRPPKMSAVKRQLRIREIYDLEILDIKGRLVLMRVECEAGTYIRLLCRHMALAMGAGGQMVELRRTKSGPFTEDECVTLHNLRDAAEYVKEGKPEELRKLILPVDRIADSLPKVVIREKAVDAICHGAVLAAVGILEKDNYKKNSRVAVITEKGELVCIGKAIVSSEDYQRSDTGLVIRPEIVVMEPGTYDKGWETKKRD
ncbi:MAG: RNA-guided pseudouridylation complex pseudouridine synthase subunit Cbf5 [Methanomicrobiaceae archaeon]|nr:RNA-guided pseudouridylation complex pseudouridine synthase subunit Cbf5 [Methanomicrobiaceae archaeon]